MPDKVKNEVGQYPGKLAWINNGKIYKLLFKDMFHPLPP